MLLLFLLMVTEKLVISLLVFSINQAQMVPSQLMMARHLRLKSNTLRDSSGIEATSHHTLSLIPKLKKLNSKMHSSSQLTKRLVQFNQFCHSQNTPCKMVDLQLQLLKTQKVKHQPHSLSTNLEVVSKYALSSHPALAIIEKMLCKILLLQQVVNL